MAIFSVSYDLNKQGQNYDAVWAELKNTSGWYHIMDSTWLLATSETVDQLSNRLTKHMDANDRLFISRVYAGQYGGWLTEDHWKWIREHV